MIDYDKFPSLSGVYLEDSYVVAIVENPGEFVFDLDAVITTQSPAYHPPRPDESYCYARAKLLFPNVSRVEWISRTNSRSTDATSEVDLGSIDLLDVEDGSFLVEGSWGRVRIDGTPPRVVLDS